MIFLRFNNYNLVLYILIVIDDHFNLDTDILLIVYTLNI